MPSVIESKHYKLIHLNDLDALPKLNLRSLFDSLRDQALLVHLTPLSFYPHSAYFSSILSESEQQRASQFGLEKLKLKFITQRALLRLLLTEITHAHTSEQGLARSLEIQYTQKLKPYLAKSSLVSSPPQFNLSHTQNDVLYAFSPNSEVGVDIEEPHLTDPISELAQHIFSQDEWRIFEDLTPQYRSFHFLKTWTQKEALSKAIGQGLELDFSKLSIENQDWKVTPIPELSPLFGALAMKRHCL